MTAPSRHLAAARLGLLVGSLLLLGLVLLGAPVEVYSTTGTFLGAYMLAVGGSAAARHAGAREPSSGSAARPEPAAPPGGAEEP
jgi:uncharacterized membrane protein HdeD (DUF308 family)